MGFGETSETRHSNFVSFPRLKILNLTNMSNLFTWEKNLVGVSEDGFSRAMHRQQNLETMNCPKLEALPT